MQREQREHLGLAPVEQQPLAVEAGLGGAEQRHHQARASAGLVEPAADGWCARARHRGLDQPGHHPRGRQADRVGAVPGGRQVDDAELGAGHRVVHRRGPADPVVHDRGVVLGAEHHRRASPAGWPGRGRWCRRDSSSQRPPATKLTVSALRRITRPPYVHRMRVSRVGDRETRSPSSAVRRSSCLDPLDGGLQRRVPPERRGLGLVGERRLAARRSGSRPRSASQLTSGSRGGPAPRRRHRARRTPSRRARRPGASCSTRPRRHDREATRPVTTRHSAAERHAAKLRPQEPDRLVHRVLPAGVERVVLALPPAQSAVDPVRRISRWVVRAQRGGQVPSAVPWWASTGSVIRSK